MLTLTARNRVSRRIAGSFYPLVVFVLNFLIMTVSTSMVNVIIVQLEFLFLLLFFDEEDGSPVFLILLFLSLVSSFSTIYLFFGDFQIYLYRGDLKNWRIILQFMNDSGELKYVSGFVLFHFLLSLRIFAPFRIGWRAREIVATSPTRGLATVE